MKKINYFYVSDPKKWQIKIFKIYDQLIFKTQDKIYQFNENKKINISNYSESDKQNIKKHASIIENEIKSNYVVCSRKVFKLEYKN